MQAEVTVPSSANAALETSSPWPRRTATIRPSAVEIRRVRSRPPLAIRRPSGEVASAQTAPS
jgi:hypothetical protein